MLFLKRHRNFRTEMTSVEFRLWGSEIQIDIVMLSLTLVVTLSLICACGLVLLRNRNSERSNFTFDISLYCKRSYCHMHFIQIRECFLNIPNIPFFLFFSAKYTQLFHLSSYNFSRYENIITCLRNYEKRKMQSFAHETLMCMLNKTILSLFEM